MRILGKVQQLWLALLFPLALAYAGWSYHEHAQRHVGACDWYGYYEQARLLLRGTVQLETAVSPATFAAIVPMGFEPAGDHAVPQYPPGYPLLLALFMAVGLQFEAAPFFGLLSCLLLYQILRTEKIPPWLAALFTVAWAFNPIVFFGATSLMSDLPAACFVMLAYLAWRRDWLWLSALALGYAVIVRPTNALFVLFLLPVVHREGRFWPYLWRLALPCVVYAAYNWALYGAPWRTGYTDIRGDLVAGQFWDRAWFYFKQTSRQLTPLLLLLVPLAWYRRGWRQLYWLLGFAALFVFYSFWRSGGDLWWWTRFLLPAYPALYLFSALGFLHLHETLTTRWGRGGVYLSVLLLAALALVPLCQIDYGQRRGDLWVKNRALEYQQVSEHCARLLPPGTWVGSVEFAGAMRIYTPALVPFVPVRAYGPELVDHALAQGHPVALLIEPWNRTQRDILRILSKHPHTQLHKFPLWGGVELIALGPSGAR